MKPSAKTCIYCSDSYTARNGEHVFPYGLGGEDVYMDCVCPKCNNEFSGQELELYQKSMVGLIRSVEGIEGYNPNKRNPAPFKAPVLLMLDEKHNIVFEVGQQTRMQVFVRPQIFECNNKFYLEADQEESRQMFADTFIKWKKEDGILTVRQNKAIIAVKFTLADRKYEWSRFDGKARKTAIQFCTLSEDHSLYEDLSPRLFMDDDCKLKVRAKTLAEAEVFLGKLLNDTLTNNLYSSFQDADLSSSIVHVGYSFDSVKMQRALIKIGLNALVHYFPQVKGNDALAPLIGYARFGNHGFRGSMENKDGLIDSVPDAHNIFFSSWQENLRIRISLFNGSFVFAFWVEGLALPSYDHYYRLIVNYRQRKHFFQNTAAFLRSFPIGKHQDK